MQENQGDAEGNNVTDREHVGCEERGCDGAMIGKFLANHLAIDKPSNNDTREETANGQHNLGCQEIAEVHQRHAEHLQVKGSGRK